MHSPPSLGSEIKREREEREREVLGLEPVKRLEAERPRCTGLGSFVGEDHGDAPDPDTFLDRICHTQEDVIV